MQEKLNVKHCKNKLFNKLHCSHKLTFCDIKRNRKEGKIYIKLGKNFHTKEMKTKMTENGELKTQTI